MAAIRRCFDDRKETGDSVATKVRQRSGTTCVFPMLNGNIHALRFGKSQLGTTAISQFANLPDSRSFHDVISTSTACPVMGRAGQRGGSVSRFPQIGILPRTHL